MTISLSVLIITKNEEKMLPRCLRSVLWADEIVVVDADSTDQTQEICKDSSAAWASHMRFYQRSWTGFRDQRNFALGKAKHEWVLVLDADEECSESLARRIAEIISLPPSSEVLPVAYKVRRVEYFLNQRIEFGVWNPSYQDRFFKKKGVQYKNEIHEYPVFPAPPQRIHEPIHHDPSFNPERFLSKMNRYTTVEAMDRVQKGQRTNWIHLLGAGPAMFLKNYFYYQAYKDGWHGVIISLLEGISRTVRHIKIWQYGRECDRK